MCRQAGSDGATNDKEWFQELGVHLDEGYHLEMIMTMERRATGAASRNPL